MKPNSRVTANEIRTSRTRSTFVAIAMALVFAWWTASDARAACGTITLTPATLPAAVPNSPFNVQLAAGGGTAPYIFTLIPVPTPPPTWLSISPAGLLSGMPPQGGPYNFTVQVTDASTPTSCVATQSYTLTVVNCTITVTPTTLPNALVPTPYSQTLTASGGTPPYSFIFNGAPPPWLTLSSSGTLSGTPTSPGTSSFGVKVTDASGCSVVQNFTLVTGVNCGVIALAPATLPNATLSSLYTQTLTASGGTPPYSFRFDGPPPPWLTLSSSGTLSGTPNTSGSFSFTVVATDSLACFMTFPRTVVVPGTFTVDFSLTSGVPPGTPITFSGSVSPAATTITAWNWDFGDGGTATGQSVTHAYSASGTYNVKLTATDNTGTSNSVIKPVSITAPTQTFTVDFTPVGGTAGTPIIFSGTVSPATSITSWSWNFGDGQTGNGQSVSHTFTTAGSYNVNLTASNGTTTNSVTKPVAISSGCTPITLGPPALAPATVNTPYSQGITVSGGTPPYIFAFAPASTPPAWLSLSPTGTLSGTPTASGTFNLIVKVTDANACSIAQGFTLNVTSGAASQFTVDFQPVSGSVGTPITFTGSVNPATTSIATWSWDFGDGTAGNGQSVTHTFAAAGTFNVKLTATSSTAPASSVTKPVVIGATTCGDKPALVSPADAATNITPPVTFAWTAVAGAIEYKLYAFAKGTTPFIIGATAATSFTANVPNGTVEWYVAASFANCADVESVHRTFSTVSCSSATPVLISPANGATNVTLPVTFTWSPVTGAVGYNVMILSGTSGAPVMIGSTAGAASLTSASLPTGTVQWYVQAMFGSCPPAESARNSFTIASNASCPTASPSLLTPADAATTITSPVSFSWTAVTGAGSYRLWAAFGSDSAKVIAEVRDTFIMAPVPTGKVEWYVEAAFPNCPSVFSKHFTFTVPSAATCGSTPPSLSAPSNGATGVSSPVTFQWSAVTNATAYKVWGTIGGAAAAPSLFGMTTSTTLTAPVPQGTIAWWVEATFASCPSTVSATSTFTVATATDCTKNAAPALIAPANGASNITSPVAFSWNAATGASGYRLYMSVNGGTFDLIGMTATETTATRLVPDGTIQWYVEAQFNGCPALQSSKSTFTAKQTVQCATGSMTLTSPANGATVSSPVSFAWSAITGTTTYRLWLSVDGAAPTIIGTTAQTSLSTSVPSGNAEWWVEATFSQGCPPIPSSHGRFTIPKAATCGNNKPVTLSAPAEGTTNAKSPVDFSWTATTGAFSYRVWIAVAGGPPFDIGVTQATHFTMDVPAGAIEWYVEALFDGCPSVSSSKGHFTIPSPLACGNQSPVPIAPAEGSTSVRSPVTFIWSAPANAVGYRVFASLDGAEPILIGAPVEASLTAQIPPGSITWFVNAIFPACNDTQSAKAHFTIARDASCPTDAPSLLSPADKATNVQPDVTFAWTPVSGAVGYQLWARFGDGNPTPIGPMSTSTQFTIQFPPAPIEWFVQALFPGCKPNESKHFAFVIPVAAACDNPRPILVSPPDGLTNVASPVMFSWIGSPKATGYKVWASADNGGSSVIGSTTSTTLSASVPSGVITWYVEASFSNCAAQQSAPSKFTVPKSAAGCSTPDKPFANVAGQVQSGTTYSVRWSPVAGANVYELQESTTPDFASPTTTVINGLSADYNRTAQTAAPYFYRVRASSSCSDDRGQYSDVIGVVVIPPPPSSQKVFNTSAEYGNQKVVVQTVFVPGFTTSAPFTATVDKSWLTVTPSSGTLPAEGMTLTVSADPTALPLGTNTGTVLLKYVTSGKTGITPNGTTPPSTVPVSVSVVTPVAPAKRNAPGPDSLIIPAVGHTEGSNNAKFQSDVRVTNVSAQTMKYLLNFTPTGASGSQSVKSTSIQIDPGQTTALDDILSSFFGVGATATNASGLGVLEIRPTSTATTGITSRVSPTTVASSRTYNLTAAGSTFGQFIPAISFSDFIGKSTDSSKPKVLSLQQLAQSKDDTKGYRTNFAVVEGAGEKADVQVTVYDKTDTLLGTISLSLAAGEHRQINRFLSANNIYADEARIEVQVTSSTGKVTAYASVIDNLTNDPLLVSPVLVSASTSKRFVIPGVADLNNGVQNWRSDIRIYNPSSSTVAAKLSFYASGQSTATKSVDVTLKAGEVRAIDDTMRSFFGLSNTGGAVHVLTEAAEPLVVTARTFTDDQSTGGTYGQFIPAITPDQSVGYGDGSLHVLQLEQSTRFRTNLGIAETTGKAATIEISVTLPDSKVTSKVQVELGANEFRQIPILTSMGLTTAYNARASVRVVSGSGKVTAYGSVIDQVTGDPTYVPAQ